MSEQKHHLLPLFQKNEVMFGHDGTAGLIACAIAGDDSVKLFSRDGEATKIDVVSFQPLMLLAGDEPLAGWQGEAKIEKLVGDGAFNRLALFPNQRQFQAGGRLGRSQTGRERRALSGEAKRTV